MGRSTFLRIQCLSRHDLNGPQRRPVLVPICGHFVHPRDAEEFFLAEGRSEKLHANGQRLGSRGEAAGG